MKIGLRIILGIFLIILTILIASFVSVNINEKRLKNYIGREAENETHETIENIDEIIYLRMQQVRFLGRMITLHDDVLLESAKELKTRDNPYEYIREKDLQWQLVPKEAITPFMKNLFDNKLAQHIRQQIAEFDPGNDIFAEIFVTNSYGVNVAQTKKTTDYYQGDETWWNQARQNDFYIGDLQFDESSGQYAITIAIGIKDAQGRFAGVLKALLSIQALTQELEAMLLDKLENIQYTLVTHDQKIIYSSEGYRPFRSVDELFTLAYKEGRGKDFLVVQKEPETSQEAFLVWAESEGFRDYRGLDWILFAQYEAETLFAPIRRMKITLLIIALFITFISVLVGFGISYSVSSPINRLNTIAQELGSGKLNVVIGDDLKKIDNEIGQFAQTFDSMYQRLKGIYDELDQKVQERTEELTLNFIKMKEQNFQLEKAKEEMAHVLNDLSLAKSDLENQTIQLEATRRKLEKSNKELEQFAYVASHDLQEPLRKIIAFGDLLKEETEAGLSDDAKDYLRRMKNASFRMRNLIEGLLQYSRLSTRAAPFEDVDLKSVLDDVLSTLELTIQETGAIIDIGHLPHIKADRMQIEQLFQNLLTNAIKFRRENEKPHISITSWPQQSGWVEISVKDNGIGFDQKYTERIFNPFQRLHQLGKFEGSGIGLSICKKIAERHGGKINVHSTPGEGTTFVIQLPTGDFERRQES